MISSFQAAFSPAVYEKMMPYTVSKNCVVAMTRTLATANDNIHHKALCPAFADTDIVSSANIGADPQGQAARMSYITRMGGLMSPEYVAEAFYQLLTRGHNGAVMAVMKNIPYFIVPEYDTTILHIVATLSQIIAKVTSNKIVSFQQLALSFGLINLIFVYFLNFVLSL